MIKSEENNLSAQQDSAQAPVLTCTSEREGESVCVRILGTLKLLCAPLRLCVLLQQEAMYSCTHVDCRCSHFSFNKHSLLNWPIHNKELCSNHEKDEKMHI